MVHEIRGLAFHELYVPAAMRNDHARAGGTGLRRFSARTPDGKVLRVMYGLEPASKFIPFLKHTSVTVAASADTGESPCRAVTDDEFSAAVELTFSEEPWEEDPKPSPTLARHAWSIDKR